jgi:hypothetical protein
MLDGGAALGFAQAVAAAALSALAVVVVRWQTGRVERARLAGEREDRNLTRLQAVIDRLDEDLQRTRVDLDRTRAELDRCREDARRRGRYPPTSVD